MRRFETALAEDAYARAETVHWCSHIAMMSMARYREVLSNPTSFHAVFPNTQFENPRLQHIIESDVHLTTSKAEVLNEQNYDLYRAWQVILGILGMTAVAEQYLRQVATKQFRSTLPATDLFRKFEGATGISVAAFGRHDRLNHYWQVRHIAMHNLSRVDERFRARTGSTAPDSPYVYFPRDLTEYLGILEGFFSFVERETRARGDPTP